MLGSQSSDAVYNTIQAALGPMVGETMAASSPRALARRLGLDGPHFTPDQANSLVEKVCQGLIVFVGRQRAVAVQKEIEHRLANGTS